MKNKIFHTQDLCLRTNLRCAKDSARMEIIMKISVIIPSLNPDDKLVSVVDSLVKKGFEDIIIVNDGSDSAHLWPFEKVGSYSQCTILTHEVNKGKGRGLKTAFEYCLKNRQGYDGVVTVDGDNQHRQMIYITVVRLW